MTVSFFVHGKPEPAGSKRAFVLKGGPRKGAAIIVDANANSKPWKTAVAYEARRAHTGEPMQGPIQLDLTFFLVRPRGHYRTGANSDKLRDNAPKYPISKPDVLKLTRGVEDACTSILWQDDAQIVTENIRKRYGRQGVKIEVAPYEEDPIF